MTIIHDFRLPNPTLIALNLLWFDSILEKNPLELRLLPAMAQEATDSEGKQRWRQSTSFDDQKTWQHIWTFAHFSLHKFQTDLSAKI